MMTPRTRIARTASTGPKVRRSFGPETSIGVRVPFLASGEQLGAINETPDAETKSIAELDANTAKAWILPVEDERLILQLPSPTSMQRPIGTSREELRQFGVAVQRSAESTRIISLIIDRAVAHRKEEHVMKERAARRGNEGSGILNTIDILMDNLQHEEGIQCRPA